MYCTPVHDSFNELGFGQMENFPLVRLTSSFNSHLSRSWLQLSFILMFHTGRSIRSYRNNSQMLSWEGCPSWDGRTVGRDVWVSISGRCVCGRTSQRGGTRDYQFFFFPADVTSPELRWNSYTPEHVWQSTENSDLSCWCYMIGLRFKNLRTPRATYGQQRFFLFGWHTQQ